MKLQALNRFLEYDPPLTVAEKAGVKAALKRIGVL